MKKDRWLQVEEIFHHAADLPDIERDAFVGRVCTGDERLRNEVMALLTEDGDHATIVDRGLADIAVRIVGGDSFPEDFGPYRVSGKERPGGMGVVYPAKDKITGKEVAIKILPDSRLSPVGRERFYLERQILAGLSHPYIAQLFQAGVLGDGTPWFAMEFVEGEPIDTYCKDHHLSIKERLELFAKLCDAVDYVHRQAIVHRDLKPANVLVTKDGTPKLLDFGIGKMLQDDTALGRPPVAHTITGLQMMTLAYAAPEQVGGQNVVYAADVYALGVILYGLLAERPPLDVSDCTPLKAAQIILEQEPLKPSVGAAHSGAKSRASKSEWNDLDAVCLQALRKEPDRRYKSVAAFAHDVRHFLSNQPLDARPDSLIYKTNKFLRRNWWQVAAASTVVLLLGAYAARLKIDSDAIAAESARKERVEKILLNIFQGGNNEVGPSKDLKVITVLDAGVKEAQTLGSDPKVQADLFLALGTVYQSFEEFDRADSLIQAALGIRQAVFGKDDKETADALVKLGALRLVQDNKPEAEHLVRRALTIDERRLPADEINTLSATIMLGRIQEQQHQNDLAIQTLNGVLKHFSNAKAPSKELSSTVTLLANAYFYKGDYASAESLNEQALAMDHMLYDPHHPNLADDYINLGRIQLELTHYPEAERYFRQALDIHRDYSGEQSVQYADAAFYLAQSLAKLQRLPEAAALLIAPLHPSEKIRGPIASLLRDVGIMAADHGNLDEAEADFSRSVTLFRSLDGDKHPETITAQINLMGVYLARKQFGRAQKLLRENPEIKSYVDRSAHLSNPQRPAAATEIK